MLSLPFFFARTAQAILRRHCPDPAAVSVAIVATLGIRHEPQASLGCLCAARTKKTGGGRW